jgi:hypothetical protein
MVRVELGLGVKDQEVIGMGIAVRLKDIVIHVVPPGDEVLIEETLDEANFIADTRE